MNFIKYKNWFFALSLIVILPGAIALSIWHLKLGIDFSGGTLWEIKFSQNQEVDRQLLADYLASEGVSYSSIVKTQEGSYLARLHESDEVKISLLKEKVAAKFGPNEDLRLETVGPTISKELATKAVAQQDRKSKRLNYSHMSI